MSRKTVGILTFINRKTVGILTFMCVVGISTFMSKKTVGILTFMSRKNLMLSEVEHEIFFITLGQIVPSEAI